MVLYLNEIWAFLFKQNLLTPNGIKCPACLKLIKGGGLQAQLEVQIREHISKYYEGWTICDDQTCGYRTRMMSVYGRRCLRPGCRGKVSFEVRCSLTLLSATSVHFTTIIKNTVLRSPVIQPTAIFRLSFRRRKSVSIHSIQRKARYALISQRRPFLVPYLIQ